MVERAHREHGGEEHIFVSTIAPYEVPMAAPGVAMYSSERAMPVSASAVTVIAASAENGRSHRPAVAAGGPIATAAAQINPPTQMPADA